MTKRIFVSVNLNDRKSNIDFKLELTRIRNELKGEKIRWVQNYNHHLTLCFLGEIEDLQLTTINCQISILIKDFKPFKVRVRNIGVFPNVKQPRIVWIGIDSKDLINLSVKINQEMKKLGLKIEHKKFSPHLTIGRIKTGNRGLSEKIKNLIEKYKDYDFGIFTVNSVDVMESILKSEGPKYKILAINNL